MSENEQPDWLAEGSEALRRQMESIVKERSSSQQTDPPDRWHGG